MTLYPDQIDGYSSLPVVVDFISAVRAADVNRIRDAIVAIQAELGINPSGTFGTVVDRLNSLDTNYLKSISTITSDYLILLTDNKILVDATSAEVRVTLPLAELCPGTEYKIKKIDSSSNAMVIYCLSGDTVDGKSAIVSKVKNAAYTVTSNGSNWFII